VRHHPQRHIRRLLRPGQHPDTQFQRQPGIAARQVKHEDPRQQAGDGFRAAGPFAQSKGALARLGQGGSGQPLTGLQLRSQGLQQFDLEPVPRSPFRKAIHPFQPAPDQGHGLVKGMNAHRRPRRPQKEPHRLRPVAGRLEQQRQLRGRLLVRQAQQCLRHRRTQPGTARRRQAAVQCILIEDVDEAIAKRRCAVGKLALPLRTHQVMLAVQGSEPVLNIGGVTVESAGQHRRVELGALHGGRRQQRPVLTPQPVQLPLDQAAHRLGQVALQVVGRAGQRPRSLPAQHGPALAQVGE
jgi:hypothetical protein